MEGWKGLLDTKVAASRLASRSSASGSSVNKDGCQAGSSQGDG